MDVLNPALEEIDGSYYRFNKPASFVAELPIEKEELFEETDCIHDGVLGEDIMPGNIQISANKELKYQFHVPKVLRFALVGPRGQTKQRLEAETNTKIWIPRKHQSGGVVIISRTKHGIQDAYRRMQMLLKSAHSKSNFTHFLSIPVQSIQIKERFNLFKSCVLEQCASERGICKELFQKPEKLHATIGILTLLDDIQRNEAITALQECENVLIPSIIKCRSIRVRIQGIDYIDNDASQAKVLYARIVDENSILQTLVDKIANFFMQKEIMKYERDHVLLHVTLMNTAFALPQEELNNSKSRHKKPITFDANKILKNFENFDFGELIVNNVHLSQKGTKGEDGFYASSYIAKFSN